MLRDAPPPPWLVGGQHDRVARRPLQAKLTDTAADGWDRLCTRQRVTYTALIEALGEQLAAGDDTWLPVEIIDRAHQIDWERRTRR